MPSFSPSTSPFICVERFVDRDMVMRFRGGGVGHKATWTQSANRLPPGHPDDVAENLEEFIDGHDGDSESVPMETDSESDDHQSEEEDYGYGPAGLDDVDSEEEEDNEGVEDDGNLGPEDGEEGWDDDDVDATGFAEL